MLGLKQLSVFSLIKGVVSIFVALGFDYKIKCPIRSPQNIWANSMNHFRTFGIKAQKPAQFG